MDTLTAIQTRNSIPHLEGPAPTHEQMLEVYKGALRAPDHARLRPWKFIEVRGEAREKTRKDFLRNCQLFRRKFNDGDKDKH